MTYFACHSGRVQFDRREMGVERVRDVDVMPINPTENLPASFIEAHSHILMNGHAMVEGQAVQHHRGTARDGPPARGPAAGRAQQEARAAAAAAQESDMHTLSEVLCCQICCHAIQLSPYLLFVICTPFLRYFAARSAVMPSSSLPTYFL